MTKNNKSIKPTEKTIKALQIVNDHEIMKAAQFARFMWPDSVMHRKTSNQGNGACKGKAAWLCGGSYLAKLEKKGVIRYSTAFERWLLTKKGEELLNNSK